MVVIHTVDQVDKPSLTIDLPSEFRGKKVEIIIQAIEDTAAEHSTSGVDDRFKPYLMPKPPLTEAGRRLLERRAAGIPDPQFRYDDPFEPVVTDDDFDMDFPPEEPNPA